MLQIKTFELTADSLSRSVTSSRQNGPQMLQIETLDWLRSAELAVTSTNNRMSYIFISIRHPQGVWVYSIGWLTFPTLRHRKEKPWLKISSTWAA